MKKFLAIMLSVLLVSALFISCGNKEEPAPAATTTPAPAATTAPETPAPAPKAVAEPAAPAPAAPAPVAPAKEEIVFRISNGAEPESLDPALIQGVPEHRIFEALFEGLVAIDPETALAVPGVAESWEVNEDGTQYTFKLREDAVWSDGVPITADDVVYSWLRLLDPMTAGPYAWFSCMVQRSSMLGKLVLRPWESALSTTVPSRWISSVPSLMQLMH